MPFDATMHPLCHEGGILIFIDTEYDMWNMAPIVLEKAFERYLEVKTIIAVNLCGTPGKIDEIRAIVDKHGVLIVKDAAESFGST